MNRRVLFVVVSMCSATSSVVRMVDGAYYRIGALRRQSSANYNRHHRKAYTVEAPSFSGDIGEIMDAAHEKANLEDNVDSGGDGSSASCVPNDGYSIVQYLSYTYEIETLPISEASALDGREVILQDVDDDIVQDNLENALNSALQDDLLDCPDNGYNSDTGIVEFDPLPRDTPEQDSTCDPEYIMDTANKCQVMVGVMKVTLMPNSGLEQVEEQVMTATQEFLNTVNNDTVTGVARARYLGPAIGNPDGATDGNDPSSDGEPADTTSNSGLSNRSIILMSLTSAGFAVVVGLVTYFRLRQSPRRRQDEIPYVATLENESSSEESPSRMDSSCDDFSSQPSSQFSSIMPTNYRFDTSDAPLPSPFDGSGATSILGPSSMGTIHESDDGNSEEGGIVISDTEYSSTGEESPIEFPYFESNYAANAAPVLGARPRTGEELEESVEDVPF